MNEHAYNTLQKIAKDLKKNTKIDVYTLLKENGYNVDLMYENGFVIDYDGEKSILEQAYDFNYVKSEAESDY